MNGRAIRRPDRVRTGDRVFVTAGPFMGRGVVEMATKYDLAVRFDNGGRVEVVARIHTKHEHPEHP